MLDYPFQGFCVNRVVLINPHFTPYYGPTTDWNRVYPTLEEHSEQDK